MTENQLRQKVADIINAWVGATKGSAKHLEILAEIDQYEKYCKANPDYQNNRTTHAVANISRVYDDRLIKHDFLKEDEP